jgi:hypothetical protein
VEDSIKKKCNIISNVLMVGDKRKYNTMLVSLKQEGATGEFPGNGRLKVFEAGRRDGRISGEW